MFLWCKAGKGVVRVHGESCPMAIHDFLFLPWQHSIVYQADENEPFLVGAIHVIPFHDRKHKVVFEVAHRDDDPLCQHTWRKDVPLPGMVGLARGSLAHGTALRHLAEHIVQRFSSGQRREWEVRCHAQLLLSALSDWFHAESAASPHLPVELQRMVQFVRSHLHEKLSLVHLARLSQLSPSAVGRLFRKHLKMTPVTFIARTKMELAQELLSTSRLPVAEVGRRVGIDDPYYFSKLFRKTVGCSPREHRKRSSLL